MKTEIQSVAGAHSNWPDLSSANGAGSGSKGQITAGTSELEVDPPSAPEFPVSVQFFERACQDIGVVTLNIRQLAAFAALGEASRKFGAIKIGRGKLIVHDDRLGELMDTCRNVISSAENASIKLEAMKLLQKVLAGMAFSAREMIKSAQVDLSDSAHKPVPMPSFLPFRTVTPVQQVQVNIDTQSKSVETRLNDPIAGSQRQIPD